MNQNIDTEIGARIVAIRSYFAVSQQALADRLDISVAELARYEKGKTPTTAALLYKLAGAFGLPLIVFLEQLENGVGIRAALRREFGIENTGQLYLLYSSFRQIDAQEARQKVIMLATRLADASCL